MLAQKNPGKSGRLEKLVKSPDLKYQIFSRPNYEEPQTTGAKSHDTYEPQAVQQPLPPKTPEKLLTPGSPMESLRRRHMSQFRGASGAPNEPFRNPPEPQAFRTSGNEPQQPYRSGVPTGPPQPAYRPSKEPQSPLVAVPIIETHVGMKPRPPGVHPMEYPVSADAYPDPGEF